MQSSITFEKACCEISQSILAREKLTVKTARDEIMRICAKYSLLLFAQIPLEMHEDTCRFKSNYCLIA